MRALGPGSVSSFLKTALDVVYVALCVAAAVIAVSGIAGLLFHPFAANLRHIGYHINGHAESLDLLQQGPILAAVLLAGGGDESARIAAEKELNAELAILP